VNGGAHMKFKMIQISLFVFIALNIFPTSALSQEPIKHLPRLVFVVNTQGDSVSLVDLEIMKEIKQFSVGKSPYGVATSSDGKIVAVGVEEEGKVKFFDTSNFKQISEIKIGKMHHEHLILSNDGRYFLLADFHSDSIIAIDAKTIKEAFRIDGISGPHVIKYGPLKKFGYSTCKKVTGIAKMDILNKKLSEFFPLNVNPRSLTFSPDESKLYFASFWVDGFFEMETKTGMVTMLLNLEPPVKDNVPQEVTYHGVEAVFPNIVLAANEGRSYVDSVDIVTGKLLDRLTQGISKPCCVQLIPDVENKKAKVIISNIGDGTIQIVEVSREGKLSSLSKIKVGEAPKRVDFLHSNFNESNQSLRFNLDKGVTGEVPSGFTNEEGKWQIITSNDGDNVSNIVAQLAGNKISNYNLLLTKENYHKDLEISVKMKALSGNIDQGGGLVWRAKDKNNYYITFFRDFI
jgi:YVTN family beta-propeller protein